jgi:hypothetical protein
MEAISKIAMKKREDNPSLLLRRMARLPLVLQINLRMSHMAKMKLADAVRRLNDRYAADLSYQQIYMLGLQRRIPVERNETGRFWVVDESNLPAMAKALGLVAVKKAKPATKPKPAAKPKPTRPARSRAVRRSAA